MQNTKPLFFSRFGTIMNSRCSIFVNAPFCLLQSSATNDDVSIWMKHSQEGPIYCEVFSLRFNCDEYQECWLYPHGICSWADGNNICPFVRCHISFLLKYFVQVYYVAITFWTRLYFCSRTKMTKGFSTSPQRISFSFTVVPSEYKLKLFVRITKDNYTSLGMEFVTY